MPVAGVYQRKDGSRPFDERFQALGDARAAARVTATVTKLEGGLRPSVKSVGEGVQEARIDYGPGYRVYFGIDGTTLLVLLLCGDKRTQKHDIALAQTLWTEYRARKGLPPKETGPLLSQPDEPEGG